MASLTKFQTDSRDLMLLQTDWIAKINPILANPLNAPSILKNVRLTTGANVINHLLGHKLQGWFIVRQRSAGTVYDTQDSNQMPELTLQLTSSANVTVDLAVF